MISSEEIGKMRGIGGECGTELRDSSLDGVCRAIDRRRRARQRHAVDGSAAGWQHPPDRIKKKIYIHIQIFPPGDLLPRRIFF